MDNFKDIRIECETELEAFRIATQFHNQLKGNPAYINNDVVIHLGQGNDSKIVNILIASGIDIPTIGIDWSMKRD